MNVAFLCVENSCRSQMAEALAQQIYSDKKIHFFSAGTKPAPVIDHHILEYLKEHGVEWHGKTKTIDQIEKPDIVVTMGCEIDCPYIPGAKIIAWDIEDPKGKDPAAYRHALQEIIKNVKSLSKSFE